MFGAKTLRFEAVLSDAPANDVGHDLPGAALGQVHIHLLVPHIVRMSFDADLPHPPTRLEDERDHMQDIANHGPYAVQRDENGNMILGEEHESDSGQESDPDDLGTSLSNNGKLNNATQCWYVVTGMALVESRLTKECY